MKLGTRASALASTQARWVADELRARGVDVEIVHVQTEGDRSSAPLTQIGGNGVFASALRTALRSGDIDCAVHCLKDLPVAAEDGLAIAAIPTREDPRDVLISSGHRRLEDLPQGSTIGTGSPRRAEQLATLAPHVKVVDIRGNVGTRIDKVTRGDVSAIVLAAAGLARLGRMDEVTQVFEVDAMLPAAGQAALAIECRDVEGRDVQGLDVSSPDVQGHVAGVGPIGDEDVYAACAVLDDSVTRACVTAERAMLATLEAGCTAPVGAYARALGQGYHLTGWAAGSHARATASAAGDDPISLGQHVAELLLNEISPPSSILKMERES